MKRFAIAVATTVLVTIAGAQPNNGPLNVNVTNTPLPVRVVSLPSPPAQPQTIMCKTGLGTGFANGQGFTGHVSGPLATSVKCPAGITAIDVKRIVVEPEISTNVTGYMFRIKVGPPDPIERNEVTEPKLLAVVTNGAPEVSLSDPVRLDLSPSSSLLLSAWDFCNSQISAGIDCGGTLYLFGNAVQ